MNSFEPDVQIKNLMKRFNNNTIIKNLSLDIPSNGFMAIVGSSGCGKSTLLRLIAGIDRHYDGQLVIHGKIQNSLGFVFQEPNLLPWLTVLENVLLPFELGANSKLDKRSCTEKALSVLSKVQLGQHVNKFPYELSGGMKMRVSLARALVTSPRLLLMDEPFAALDEMTRFEMQDLLLQLWKESKLTVLFVTHSLTEAAYLSQQVIGFKNPADGIYIEKKTDFHSKESHNIRASTDLNQFIQELSQELKA